MTLKQYLILMTSASLICWLAWFFVILNSDPSEAGLSVFFLFYATLFLGLLGVFSVIGFLIKRKILKNDEVVFRHVKNTFRQSMIVSFLLVLSLILLQMDLLRWWNALLLLLVFVLLELVIFSQKKMNY